MDNKSIDYGKSFKSLLVQTFSFKRYKEFGLIPSIIFGVLLSPFLLCIGLYALIYVIVYTLFKILASPADYLTAFLHQEGETVKHATQFIIYFIGFPTVFFLNVVLSFFSVVLFLLFIILSLLCQIFSIGGVQFMPFLNNQKERTEVDNLTNLSLERIIKLSILISFTVIGIIIEIVNAFEHFALPAVLFFIIYLIGSCLILINFAKNKKDGKKSIKDQTTNTAEENDLKNEETTENITVNEANEEKPVKKVSQKEEKNLPLSPKGLNLSLKISLITSIVTSVISLIMFIVTRSVYFYKNVAFNITLSFTIISLIFLVAFLILFIIRIAKFKNNSFTKSLLYKIGLICLAFSSLIGGFGIVSSSANFYSELTKNDPKNYYGVYKANIGELTYFMTVDKDNVHLSTKINGKTIESNCNYYYATSEYAKSVCGIDSHCLIVDTSGFKGKTSNDFDIFYSEKNTVFEINSVDNSIIVSPKDRGLRFTYINSI